MKQDKMSKYFKYAIGEILLVVIGILIALQINNWNEQRKNQEKVNDLRAKLINELETDLLLINKQSKSREKYKHNILNYVEYLNVADINMDTLLVKKDQADYTVHGYSKTSFTLDELTSTGSINLFTNEEKQAIIELKSTQELFNFYERESMNEVSDNWKLTSQAIDGLYDKGLTKKQHRSVRNWQYNLESDQYRIYHNELFSVLELYKYQTQVVYPTISKYTNRLIEVLNKNK